MGVTWHYGELAGRGGCPVWMKPIESLLVEPLHEGPGRLGYETPLWTCERVSHLIEKNFHVECYRSPAVYCS